MKQFCTISLASLTFFLCCLPRVAPAQDSKPQSSSRGLIDFNRDILPILNQRCLECHGSQVAKNDFRVDDKDSLMGYITPGDLKASTMWTDYLTTDVADQKMPPAIKPQLTGVELAAIRLWIEEGAVWSPPAASAEAGTGHVAPSASRTLFQRITGFLGLFHPAAVHMPIALLFVSFLFLVGTLYNRPAFESAAFHCLWTGALGAVLSCTLGWFYAEGKGYSGPWLDFNDALQRHRWSGVIIAVLALGLIPLARQSKTIDTLRGPRLAWLIGAFILATLVGIAGHQGGELHYGEQVFSDAYNAIFESQP